MYMRKKCATTGLAIAYVLSLQFQLCRGDDVREASIKLVSVAFNRSNQALDVLGISDRDPTRVEVQGEREGEGERARVRD